MNRNADQSGGQVAPCTLKPDHPAFTVDALVQEDYADSGLKDVLPFAEYRKLSDRIVNILCREAVRMDQLHKEKPETAVPPAVKDIEPFTLCMAVLSDDILQALPGTRNIILKQFSRAKKVSYALVQDFRVVYGRPNRVIAFHQEVVKLAEDFKNKAEAKKQEKKIKEEPKATVKEEKTDDEDKVDEADELEEPPPQPNARLRQRVVKELDKSYMQRMVDKIHQGCLLDTPTVSPDGRRISGRLTKKGRKSYRHQKWQAVLASTKGKTSSQRNDKRLRDSMEESNNKQKSKSDESSGRRTSKRRRTESKDEEQHPENDELHPEKNVQHPENDVQHPEKEVQQPEKDVPTVIGQVKIKEEKVDDEVAAVPAVEEASFNEPPPSEEVGTAEPTAVVEGDEAPKTRKRCRSNKPNRDQVCDICFRMFSEHTSAAILVKHRESHFTAEGKLNEAAMLLHSQALRDHEMAENLPADLVLQIKEYLQSLEQTTPGPNQQSVESVEMEEGTPVDEPSTTRRGRRAHCDKGLPVVVDGKPVSLPGQPQPTEPVQDEPTVFPCDLCCCRLLSARALESHRQKVHMKPPGSRQSLEAREMRCPHCEFVCNLAQVFVRHLRSHNKPKLFVCSLCSYSHRIKSEVLRHQRNTHAEKALTCDQCGSKHRSTGALKSHIRLKHEQSVSAVCELCGKSFNNKIALKGHMKKHQRDDEQPHAQIMCNMCARILPSKRSFEQHIAKYHGEDKDSQEMKEMNEGVNILSDGTFSCKYCVQYTNTAAREVRRHILRRHMSKTHQCDQCKAAFPLEKLLQKHIRVVHYGLEKKKCPSCKKWFRNNSFLTAHMKRTHSNEAASNQCHICNKQFCDKRALEQHLEIHKPPEERVYKYSCTVCDKKFLHLSNYDYHMTSHSDSRDHPCTVCGKTFRVKHVLDRHMATHTEERPHACQYCEKAFKLKKYLDAHLLTHTGEKFLCSLCQKVFGNAELLEKHTCKAMALELTDTVMDVVGGVVVESEGFHDEKVEVQPMYYMCSSCGVGFPDVEAAAGHVCSSKSVDNTLNQINQATDAQTESSQLVSSLMDHQNYVIQEADASLKTEDSNAAATVLLENTTSFEPTEATDVHLVTLAQSTDQSLPDPTNSTEANLVTASNLAESSNTLLISTSEDQQQNANDGQLLIATAGTEPVAEGQLEMFMCGVCNAMFSSTNDIQVHLQIHEQESLTMSADLDVESLKLHQVTAETGQEVEGLIAANSRVVQQGQDVMIVQDISKQDDQVME